MKNIIDNMVFIQTFCRSSLSFPVNPVHCTSIQGFPFTVSSDSLRVVWNGICCESQFGVVFEI